MNKIELQKTLMPFFGNIKIVLSTDDGNTELEIGKIEYKWEGGLSVPRVILHPQKGKINA